MRRVDRSAVASLVVIAALVAVGAAVAADAIKIGLLTRVTEGQQPKVRLQFGAAVDRVVVKLERDDGRQVTASFSGLEPGGTREVLLPGDAGKHGWTGKLLVTQNGATREDSLSFETVVSGPLRVELDKSKVDLQSRSLELRLTRPAGSVDVTIYGATGSAPVAETSHDFKGRGAGETLVVTWPPTAEPPARIALKVHDADGFYQGLELLPWAVSIPHEEVVFATDSAAIGSDQAPKLAASLKLVSDALAKHRALGPIKLFIAGHTDTVGKPVYNVRLSQQRAQAIASWFRKRGLRLPIFFEGFGEHALAVATADETDERRNRRVDYILAIEEPALKTTGFRAGWKRMP